MKATCLYLNKPEKNGDINVGIYVLQDTSDEEINESLKKRVFPKEASAYFMFWPGNDSKKAFGATHKNGDVVFVGVHKSLKLTNEQISVYAEYALEKSSRVTH